MPNKGNYDRVRTKRISGGYEHLYFKGNKVVFLDVHKKGKHTKEVRA